MKIENIIDDIIEDIKAVEFKLKEQITNQNPTLNFSINLPDIEKLSPIKVVEIIIHQYNTTYILRAEIHTHNGWRVFEYNNEYNEEVNDRNKALLKEWFKNLLREIIKKSKHTKKSIAVFPG